MNVTPHPDARLSLACFVAATANADEVDALECRLDTAQWATLANFLSPLTVSLGQTVAKKGVSDRSVYLIETGTVSVHYEDEKERLHLAIVGPGSVVGEGGFFSHLPRRATVSAASDGRLWCLSPMRYGELLNRHCAVAHALTMAMGQVMAKRLYHRLRRVAVT